MKTYTQAQCDEMSEEEKLVAVTTKANDVEGWELTADGDHFYHCGADGSQYFDVPVVKLTPNDIMPIAFKYEIGIQFDAAFRKDWEATVIIHTGPHTCECVGPCYNKNPLIAIVDCFLQMEIE